MPENIAAVFQEVKKGQAQITEQRKQIAGFVLSQYEVVANGQDKVPEHPLFAGQTQTTILDKRLNSGFSILAARFWHDIAVLTVMNSVEPLPRAEIKAVMWATSAELQDNPQWQARSGFSLVNTGENAITDALYHRTIEFDEDTRGFRFPPILDRFRPLQTA